jgi:hypothetical protein
LPPWRTLAARQRRRRSGVQTPSILFYVANNGQIQSLLSFRDKRSIELVCCRTFSCSAILASAGGWNVWIGRPETQHDNVVEAPTICLECYKEKMIDENCRHALPKKTGATSRALLLALRVNVHFGANTPFRLLLWTSVVFRSLLFSKLTSVICKNKMKKKNKESNHRVLISTERERRTNQDRLTYWKEAKLDCLDRVG